MYQKNLTKISIFLSLLLLIGCGNPELKESERLLGIAIADKNHSEILIHADSVLSVDPENISAISAFRDSARIYIHIQDASKNLLKLEETTVATTLPFSLSTPIDDIELIKYLQQLYNDNFVKSETFQELKVDGETGALTNKAIRELNLRYTSVSDEDATNSPSESLIRNLLIQELSKNVLLTLDEFSEKVNLLTEAKKSLKKAERLDPRFRGVIELEELIENRAELFTFYLHKIMLSDYFLTVVPTYASYYDGVRGLMDSKLSLWRMLDMYSYGPSDAYRIAKSEVDDIYPLLEKQSSNDSGAARKLLSIYKDLEDDFDDIDSIDPAIELTEAVIDVIKLSMGAEGSMNDWSSAMSEAISNYSDSTEDLTNEIEPLEDLNEERSIINDAIEEYLDDRIINALENSSKYI
jgi:hypothetical protein|tara:strand:+ start:142 stop:1371 length:1230 start_codon:yes stop_codon:yes gene_type:complete